MSATAKMPDLVVGSDSLKDNFASKGVKMVKAASERLRRKVTWLTWMTIGVSRSCFQC